MTPENIWLDVEEFDSLIRSAKVLSEETVPALEKAIQLCSGEYLRGFDYTWADNERQRLNLLWIDKALQLLSWYYTTGRLDKAIELGTLICHRFPLEENAYFLLMKSYAGLGNRLAVTQFYVRLADVMKAELSEEPNPSITAWYEAWKESNRS